MKQYKRTASNRVAIAMSGGIDSSVSALLLKSQGYDCVGIYMNNWDKRDEYGQSVCTTDSDKEDAEQVCKRLDIPLIEVDFSRDYWIKVFDPFLNSYASGVNTPNPDIDCNRYIKFDKLRRFAIDRLDVNCLATGHYARLQYDKKIDDDLQIPRLMCGSDRIKDQSYFLCRTSGEFLKDYIFPVGSYSKLEVRLMATDVFSGLNVLKKKESSGVCFIGERNMASFLSQYITLTPGRFVDVSTGEVVGHHSGKETLTYGQKARISGQKEKYYVVKKLIDSNDVFVARGSTNSQLLTDKVTVSVESFVWISGAAPDDLLTCDHWRCRVRYNDDCIRCNIAMTNNQLVVFLHSLTPIVSPGQVLALYKEDVCYGGGIVIESFK